VFDTINFLRHYEQHPCLWDKTIPDFRNRLKRNTAEEKLLPISGLSNRKELRAKIRSIRGTYNQEVGKIKNSLSMALDSKDIYKPKLNWFSYADSFLRKNFELCVKVESDSMLLDEEIDIDDGTSQNFNVHDTEHTQEQDVSLQIQPKKRALQKQNILKFNSNKLPKINSSLDDTMKASREVSSSSCSSNNEFAVFGQLVATQLAQLPLEEAIHLQQEIQTKIYESRLKHLHFLSF